MRLRLFTPLRAKITSSAQSLVPPSGRPSQESSLPILTSFDHLVGAGEQRRRNFKADRAGGRQVDDQFKLGRPHYREVSRLGALEDFAGVDTGLPVRFRLAGSVAHQAAGFRKVAQGI